MLPRRILSQSLACLLFSQAYTASKAVIEEVPHLEAGTYEGIVSRNTGLDGGLGLGGKLDLQVTAGGSLTGAIQIDGATLRFRGNQTPSAEDPTSLRFPLPKGKRGPALTLVITQDPFSGQPSYQLIAANEASATIQVQRRATDLAEAGEHLQGNYTWKLEPFIGKPLATGARVSDRAERAPEGCGFMSGTVQKSGILRWAGRLADGTAVTGSGYLTEGRSIQPTRLLSSYQVAWHKVLYSGKGSVQGWFELEDEDREDQSIDVNGELDWKKLKVSDAFYVRNYRDGFPLHELAVRGGSYQKPAAGERVIDLDATVDNAEFTVSRAGLPSPVTHLLTVNAQNKAVFSKLNEGYPVTQLTLHPATGTFTGTLLFRDISPRLPTTSIERSVRFHGVLLSRSSTGAGFFMLGQLPTEGPPPTTMRYSPELSGKVDIEASSLPESQGFVYIPGGDFQMGDSFNEGNTHERPVHTVNVSDFYMQKKEVTKSQWDVVYKWALNHGYAFANAGLGRAANHPVTKVNWHDAIKWCNARSEMEGLTPVYYHDGAPGPLAIYRTGQPDLTPANVLWEANGYRLPTEAEWERAARGYSQGQRFPFGDYISHDLANYYAMPDDVDYDESEKEGFHPVFGFNTASTPPYIATSPVGSFEANDFGLYDMIGNAEELCWDVYREGYYNTPGPFINPKGPNEGHSASRFRIMRGGSFASLYRTAHRQPVTPDFAEGYMGLRLVRSIVNNDN